MNKLFLFIVSIFLICCSDQRKKETKILFLHHSTGYCVWKGNYKATFMEKLTSKVTGKNALATVPIQINQYNKENGKNLAIYEQIFPKNSPYGWKNYPFDYYAIWVKNAGNKPYMEEPTLEILTKEYNVIVLKHCFPVSEIIDAPDTGDINSETKTLANYKLQYLALRDKMDDFPDTKFVVWTPSALTKDNTNEQQALNTRKFYNWIITEWDLPNDNIYLWDFYNLETEGGLYLKDMYATLQTDSHPNTDFAEKASKLFVKRLVDIIETNGSKTNLKGEQN